MIHLLLALIAILVTGISLISSRHVVSAQLKSASVRDGYKSVNESAGVWFLYDA